VDKLDTALLWKYFPDRHSVVQSMVYDGALVGVRPLLYQVATAGLQPDALNFRSQLMQAFERADMIHDPAERARLLTFVVELFYV